jgi:hypothetical protein
MAAKIQDLGGSALPRALATPFAVLISISFKAARLLKSNNAICAFLLSLNNVVANV